MPRLESTIEKELVKRAKKNGGVALKLTGVKGIPDRLVLLPNGDHFFVELKSDTGELEEVQDIWRHKLQSMGHKSYVVRDCQTLDYILSGEK